VRDVPDFRGAVTKGWFPPNVLRENEPETCNQIYTCPARLQLVAQLSRQRLSPERKQNGVTGKAGLQVHSVPQTALWPPARNARVLI
jgi:hypothetical protein